MRTCCVGTTSIRSSIGRVAESTVGALRAEAVGHDVSIRAQINSEDGSEKNRDLAWLAVELQGLSPMALSPNKEIAWAHWRLLNEGKLEESLEPLNDAGTWWNLSRREATPMLDFKTRIRRALGLIPIHFTLHTAIEEGDRVLMELESHATLPDGSLYNNVYCFLLTIWDDSVLHVREYYDSKRLDALLAALPDDIRPPSSH